MLQNMGHPAAVGGRGSETEGEKILLIIIMDMVNLTSGFYMFKEISFTPILFQIICADQFISGGIIRF